MSQQTHFWLAAEDCSKFLSYRGPVNGTVAFEIPFHEIKILTFTMAYLYSKSSAPVCIARAVPPTKVQPFRHSASERTGKIFSI